MDVHVFIDNSNVWIGAQKCATEKEPHFPTAMLRINFEQFFRVLERDRVTTNRILAGSVPPECATVWEIARRHGYQTDLLKKVESDKAFRKEEQAVDEILHLKMANAVLDNDPGIIVLATGDGRVSEYKTSFPQQIERALRKGWRAEIWAWKNGRSKNWNHLKMQYKDNCEIYDLDRWYETITFFERDKANQTGFKGRPSQLLEHGKVTA